MPKLQNKQKNMNNYEFLIIFIGKNVWQQTPFFPN